MAGSSCFSMAGWLRRPGGRNLALPTLAAAQVLAAEWAALGEMIDPALMPWTRIVNSAIDGVAYRLAATVDEITKYAGSDLVCYRAGEPEALVRAQAAAWDPVLAFARKKLGASFICTERRGVHRTAGSRFHGSERSHRAHREWRAGGALRARRAACDDDAHRLGLACSRRGAWRATATDAWRVAHVDEDFEMRAWGEDAQALRRRARQWREMEAAAGLYQAVSG